MIIRIFLFPKPPDHSQLLYNMEAKSFLKSNRGFSRSQNFAGKKIPPRTHKSFTHPSENVTWSQPEGNVFPMAIDTTAGFDIIPWQKIIIASIKYGICR